MVGYETMDFVRLWVINLDHPERIGTFFLGPARRFNGLIPENISVLGRFPFPDAFIRGVFVQFGDKIDFWEVHRPNSR